MAMTTYADDERKQKVYLYQARGKNLYEIRKGYGPERPWGPFVTEDWVRCGEVDDLAVEQQVKERLHHYHPSRQRTNQFENLLPEEIRWLRSLGFKSLPTYNRRDDLDPNGPLPAHRNIFRQFLAMALYCWGQTPNCYYRVNKRDIQLTALFFAASCRYNDGKFVLGPADYAITDDIHEQCSPEPRAILEIKFAMTQMVRDGLAEYVDEAGWWTLTPQGVEWVSRFFHKEQLDLFAAVHGFYRQSRRQLRAGVDVPATVVLPSLFDPH